jgi:hypothetical protein
MSLSPTRSLKGINLQGVFVGSTESCPTSLRVPAVSRTVQAHSLRPENVTT